MYLKLGRALSALGFAKKCQDEDFRKFLGEKKLSRKNKAHNFGQHMILNLQGKFLLQLISYHLFSLKVFKDPTKRIFDRELILYCAFYYINIVCRSQSESNLASQIWLKQFCLKQLREPSCFRIGYGDELFSSGYK